MMDVTLRNNLALFAGYKLSLSMDAAYVRAYYPNGFNIFNELPLHLCNINLFLIPLGVWKRNRSIMGFSFFVIRFVSRVVKASLSLFQSPQRPLA